MLQVIVIIILIAVAMWAVNTYVPMQQTLKNILNIVVVILVVLWLLQVFGVFSFIDSPPPRLGR